jgi:hypothetical protein
MSDRTITITMSIEYAQTAIDSLENDIELSGSGYPNFRDVSEMTYYLRRAELLQMLLTTVREANAAEEDVYVNACDDENCECRKASVFPNNIRSGCACKEAV